MLGNLIDILIQKTSDGNIKWISTTDKWGCEYGKVVNIVSRNHTLKCELFYSDKKGKVTDVVFVVYSLNDKLSHVTSDDYPNLKELAQDIYALQIEKSEEVMSDAFKTLKVMPKKKRIIPKVKDGKVVKEKKNPTVVKKTTVQNDKPETIVKTKTVTKTKIVEVEKDDSNLPAWKKFIKRTLDL